MSETNTTAAPSRGLKAGKVFRKEDQGLVSGIRKKPQQPFITAAVSRTKDSAEAELPDIQSLFIPGIHLSADEDTVQPKCASCEAETPVQRSAAPEPDVQMHCASCEAAHEEPVQLKEQEEQVAPKEMDTAPQPVQASPLQLCAACDHETAAVQPSLKVGVPDDHHEKEADSMAEKVMRMPQLSFAPGGGIRPEGGGGQHVQRSEEESTGDIQPKTVAGLQRSPNGGLQTSNSFTARLKSGGPGNPLPQPVRQGMESAFQADFSPVKIHTGTEAASLSNEIGAQAFAYKNHIYFNENKYDPGSSEGKFLLAHELTHTVQQGASKTVQRDVDDNPPPKEESWLDKLKKGFDNVLETILPASVYDIYQKIKKGGLLNYIKDILFGLFKGLFNKIGFSDKEIMIIIQIFVQLKSQLPAIIDGLSKGDCKPLFAAMDMLSMVMGAVAGRIWDRLMEAIEPARVWLLDVWNTYAAPAIDKITAFAGEAWEKIKRFGKWLWDLFYKWVIQPQVDAWKWIAKKLGFGDDSDEPGLMGYVSNKLGEAWESIKKDLRPVIEPIQQVIEGIKALVDMDKIRKLQEDAKKWLDEVVKTATAMGSDEDAVANKQLTLREVLLPALNKSIDRLKRAIGSVGDWLVEKVNNVADKVNGFVTGIQGNSFLSPVYSLISWIPKTVNDIRDWATDKVHWVFDKIIAGVEYLRKFIEPIISALEKIVTVVGDILGHLPDFILGVPFMFLPKCIKDPIKKWLTEVVLKKIPIIAEFIEFTEKWDEIKTAALVIIKQVFVDGQLGKGLWTFFKTLLNILGIDPTLVTTVVAKAAQNFSDIISKPGEFLKNVWMVVKGGFKRFFDNILIHLPTGALNWLFGEVKGAVQAPPPTKITLGSILEYVMALFGISAENVYKRMEENPRIGAKKVAKIKKLVAGAIEALDWIVVWVKEGPEGLLKKAKAKLGDIKDLVINGVVSWVTAKISAEIMTRLATSSDPLGIGATINTIRLIYGAIRTGVAYANRILNLANQAMDNLAEIIAGQVENAQVAFEKVLAKAVPIVIGFAVELLIGPVGDKIKEIVMDARKVVDDTIDWLINMAMGAIDVLADVAKSVADKVLGWLGLKKEFTAVNGEQHELSFKGTEQNAALMIASNPVKYEVWVQSITSPAAAHQKTAALNKAKEIDKLKTKSETPQYTKEMKEKDIRALLDKLSELTGPLFAHVLPVSAQPNYSTALSAGGSWGISMTVDGLTKNHKPGSRPSAPDNKAYSIINKRRNQAGSYYVKGHLLNEKLGGPGFTWENLTPLTGTVNGEHERIAEARVKTAVNAGNIVKYSVTAIYNRPASASLEKAVDKAKGLTEDPQEIKEIMQSETFVATKLLCSATMKNPTKNNEETTLVPKNTTIINTLDQLPESYSLTGLKRPPIYLDSTDLNDILAIGSTMTKGIAIKIVRANKNKQFQPDEKRFGSVDSLVNYEISGKRVFSPAEGLIIEQVAGFKFVKLYKNG